MNKQKCIKKLVEQNEKGLLGMADKGRVDDMVDIKILVATKNEKYEHNKIGGLSKNKFFLPV